MRTNLLPKKETTKAATKTKKSKKEANKVDMVIAFDTTGSMSSYIGDVKARVLDLIPTLFDDNPNLQLGIVAFGDYCDMPNKDDFGPAYQCLPLSTDIADIQKFVKSARNTGGGDSDEFYELVIKKINEETDWRPDAKHAVMFIADCNPHSVGYSYRGIVSNSQIDWRNEAKKAKELNIEYDTCSIHGDRYPWYKELAEITGGVYSEFQSSGNTSEYIKVANAYRSGLATQDSLTVCAMSLSEVNPEMSRVYTAYAKSL